MRGLARWDVGSFMTRRLKEIPYCAAVIPLTKVCSTYITLHKWCSWLSFFRKMRQKMEPEMR